MPRLADLDRPTGLPVRRYEVCHPGGLVHQDHKKLGRIPDGGGHRVRGRAGIAHGSGLGYDHFEVIVDDRSRKSVVVHVPDETAASAASALGTALAVFAADGISVERVLTDNGWAYRSAAYRAVLGERRHSRTRPRRPQTNGKDVHLCQAASSARSGMNSVPALSIAQRTRSFVRARAMIA
jgi:transposase InsO family protein